MIFKLLSLYTRIKVFKFIFGINRAELSDFLNQSQITSTCAVVLKCNVSKLFRTICVVKKLKCNLKSFRMSWSMFFFYICIKKFKKVVAIIWFKFTMRKLLKKQFSSHVWRNQVFIYSLLFSIQDAVSKILALLAKIVLRSACWCASQTTKAFLNFIKLEVFFFIKNL